MNLYLASNHILEAFKENQDKILHVIFTNELPTFMFTKTNVLNIFLFAKINLGNIYLHQDKSQVYLSLPR